MSWNIGATQNDGWDIGATQSDEAVVSDDVFFEMLHKIEQGMKPLTAAGMGGVLEE